MNPIAYFEIQATDPKKLAEFYHSVFGWKFEKDARIPIEYYRIVGSGSGLPGAILQRPVKVPPPHSGTNAFTCSVEVQSFDEIAEKILKLGGIVAMEKFAIPGKCWQGYFLDTDSNVFGIFQADPKAA